MKKLILLVNFILILFTVKIYSQEIIISGTIKDKLTGERLPFANLKLSDSTYGTTADKDGYYILRLNPGKYSIIISYIGYNSVTIEADVNNESIMKDILLEKNAYITEEIQVLGEDPAIEIIKNAVLYKKNFLKTLDEYNYDAYSKVIMRTNISGKDSLTPNNKFGILGILESETKGYFKSPDMEKQIVKSKRETANISKGFIIPLIVNFYEDKIDLGETKLPGIISENCFDSYEYKLKSITYQDSNKIFKIEITNKSNIVPQFYGNIYIMDSIFALKKIDLKTNKATDIRGIDSLRFQQKFSQYKDKNKREFWMPTDIQIYADGSFTMLLKYQAEVYTIVNSYNINEKAPAGIFDEYIIKVMPDAEKDSSYWANHQQIKNSDEEIDSYKSIEKTSDEKKKSINFGIGNINFGQKFFLNYSDLYKFNKVEGNVLQLSTAYGNSESRFYGTGVFGYGFNDKKPKYEIELNLSLLKDKSLRLKFDGYRQAKPFFRDLDELGKLENTVRTIIFKQELYDYYYSGGFSASVSKQIFPQLEISLSYSQEKYQTAFKTSDFSIFTPSKKYPDNIPANEYFRASIGGGLKIDPNVYKSIDWGDGSTSKIRMTYYPEIKFEYLYSGKDIGSTYENKIFSLYIEGHNYINSFINIRYRLGGEYTSGDVPYQNLSVFYNPSILNSTQYLFYTMNYREYLGDRILRLNLENDFGKLIFGNIPFLKKLSFLGFVNVGRAFISDNNYMLSPSKNYSATDGYFVESGFGIGRIFDIIRVNFAWRLSNYRQGENFSETVIIDGF